MSGELRVGAVFADVLAGDAEALPDLAGVKRWPARVVAFGVRWFLGALSPRQSRVASTV